MVHFVRVGSVIIAAYALLLGGCEQKNFDLVCKVKEHQLNNGQSKDREKTAVIKVDMGSGIYCIDDCKSISKIHEIQPGLIIFTSRDNYQASPQTHTYTAVNRMTGDIVSQAEVGDNSNMIFYLGQTGRCEPKGFSGIPSVRF